MKKSRVSKRLIAVLASLCLIFSSVVPATILSVGAEDVPAISLDVPSTGELKPGDTFDAVVKMDSDVGYGGIEMDINYDPDVLAIADYRFDFIFSENGRNVMQNVTSLDKATLPDRTGRVHLMSFLLDGSNSAPLDNVSYATITFQVVDTCTVSSSTISVSNVVLGNYSGDSSGSGTVTGTTINTGLPTVSTPPIVVEPTGSLALQADKAAAKMGDKVTVSVLGTSNVPVAGVQYAFSYDTSKLKFVSSTVGEGFSSTKENVDEENGVVRNMLVGINNTPELTESNLNNTVLATYTFEVISRDEGASPFNFTSAETKMGWYNEEGMEEYVTLTATDGASVNITDSNIGVIDIALNKDVLDFSMDKADGQTATLVVTETPEDNTQDLTYTWKSDDTSVATVDEDGVVTAVGAGSTTITVTASNGMKASAEVYVSDLEFTAPEGDNFDVTYDVDNTLNFSIKDNGKTSSTLTYNWSSDDEDVATVDSNGKVTLLKSGTATITVKASNGVAFSKTITANVRVPLEEVSLNEENVQLSLNEGGKSTADLDVTYRPAEGYTDKVQSVVWTSSDSDVVEVSQQGVITAKKGDAKPVTITVTVTTDHGVLSDTAKVYVSDLSFDTSSVDVEDVAGTTLSALTVTQNGATINDLTYTWSSSDTNVLTVDQNGKVTLVGNGTANVQVNVTDGDGIDVTFTKTYNVKILVHMTGIEVNFDSLDLSTTDGDKTANLKVTTVPGDANDTYTVAWSSDNDEVATVSDQGVVTATGVGTTEITVTVTTPYNTFTKTIPVNVANVVVTDGEDAAIDFAGEENIADMNDYFDVEGTAPSVIWESSDSSVAIVNDNGEITFVGNGSVTITGTFNNGQTVTKTFEVSHNCVDYLTHVDRVEPTTEAEGNIEYWYCSFCNKYYADAEGTQEISAEDTVLAKLPAEETPSTPGGDDTTSTPGGTTSEGTTSGGESTTTPQTGDSSNMMLWSSLAVLALLGLGTGVVVLKKKSRSK